MLVRTGALSYYDFLRDEGVSNVGGIRPQCFIDVFPAGGLVFAPDNLAGCTCSYLDRTSIALQPPAQKEHWALFMGRSPEPGVVSHLVLNIGAIGDRRDRDGTLWLAMPRPPMQKTSRMKVDARAFVFGPASVSIEYGDDAVQDSAAGAPPTSWPCGYSDTRRPDTTYNLNTDTTPIAGTDTPWIFTSGNRGPMKVSVNASKMPADQRYRIRLHFAEVEDTRPGERVFDVRIGGKIALPSFDVLQEARAKKVAVVKEFVSAAEDGAVTLSLSARKGEPVLSGLEIVAVDDGSGVD